MFAMIPALFNGAVGGPPPPVTGIFVKDTFQGAAGSPLTSHVGEIGGWYNDNGYSDTNYGTILMALDGNGHAYAALSADVPGGSVQNDQESTGYSDVLAPQMDFYTEMVISMDVFPDGSCNFIVFYDHQLPRGLNGQFYYGLEIDFFSGYTQVNAPNWMQVINGAARNVSVGAIPLNTPVTIRIEYRYTAQTVTVFLDGVQAFLMAGPNYVWAHAATVPGHFAFDLDSLSSAPGWGSSVTGRGISVDSVELGTL